MNLRFYVWKDYRSDYTPGVAAAVADSVDAARAAIVAYEAAHPRHQW